MKTMTFTEAFKNFGRNAVYAAWIAGGFVLAATFPMTYMCLFTAYALNHYFLVEGSRPNAKLKNSIRGPNIIPYILGIVFDFLSETPIIGGLFTFINDHLITKPAEQLLNRSEKVIPSLLHVAIIALAFYFFGVPAIVQTAFAFMGLPNLLTAMGPNLIGLFFIAQHTQNFIEATCYLAGNLIDLMLSIFRRSLFSELKVEPYVNPLSAKPVLKPKSTFQEQEEEPVMIKRSLYSLCQPNWHTCLNLPTLVQAILSGSSTKISDNQMKGTVGGSSTETARQSRIGY